MSEPAMTRAKAVNTKLAAGFQSDVAQTWADANEHLRTISECEGRISEAKNSLATLSLKLVEEFQQTPTAISRALDRPLREVSGWIRQAREERKQIVAPQNSEATI